MQLPPASRAARQVWILRTSPLAGVSVQVRQSGPVLLSDCMRLSKHEVPVWLGVTGDPEGEVPRILPRQVNRTGKTLVRDVGNLRVHVIGARMRCERAARPIVLCGSRTRELWVIRDWQDAAGRDER